MVVELKKGIDAGNVLFGVKQMIKNSNDVKLVYVTKDAREETVKILEDNKIDFDFLEVSREEVAQKLELDFLCEVFSLKK